MKVEIVTQYPAWYFVFCVLLGLLYSGIAYYRHKKNSEIGRALMIALFSFRLIAVSVLAFLLLVPFIKTINTTLEKPVLILAADNSKSILASGLKSADVNAKFLDLKAQLSEDFEVQFHSFGEKISEPDSLNFSEKTTNFSLLFEELEARYSNKNIGALVVMSDGIYNSGQNPVYANNLKHVPVYSVLVGDTTLRKDLFIKELYFNNITYLGNEFPIEVLVDCEAGKNEKTVLSVAVDGVIKTEQEIVLNQLPLTQKVMLKADKSGMHKITVKVKALAGEKILINNSREVYIEVLDGRQKILLLSKSSHPDVGAIKTIVESNENYKVDVFQYDNFKGNIDPYNMVVLHQLPDDFAQTEQLLKKITKNKIGLLLVLGTQMKYQQLSRSNFGVQWQNISSGVRSFNDAYPALEKNFTLFSLTEGTKEFMKDVPPLKVPFIQFSVPGNAENLALQKIGSVNSGLPLISFYNLEESKVCLIAGEGFWRWKLSDFLKNQSEVHFEEFFQKTVQYLSLKSDKSNFKITHKKKFSENEEVILDAELYNDSYELNNSAEIKFKLINEAGKEFAFVFDKTADKYRLNLSFLAPGNYRYEAKTTLGAKQYSKQGAFVVEELKLEDISTRADVSLMKKLAEERNGKLFFLNENAALVKAIKERDDIKPVEHSTVEMKELIHQKWIFFLIAGLLSLEWLVRKRAGLK
ncbi:MAG: hypothetical protein NT150_00095 [Bacteroidetes bacterium]|nr:hypothetical protein [Bacteroidota bacterium]